MVHQKPTSLWWLRSNRWINFWHSLH